MGSLKPSDWLLLLLAEASDPLDRVRIQKSLFLFSKRSKAPAEEKYIFQPYLYGPFSSTIYRDLDRLAEEGKVRVELHEGAASPFYRLSPTGRKAATELQEQVPQARLELLRAVRTWVSTKPFSVLLRTIYQMYPEFAAESIFRDKP
jgi:uncharacterized protein YwgA